MDALYLLILVARVRPHARAGPGRRAPGRKAVSVMNWVSGLLALFLFGYLLYALIRAEKF